jgi:hypothetical protein
MKIRQLTVLLIILLFVPLFLSASFVPIKVSAQTSPNLYFGVDVAYENVTVTKQLIDKVKAYTNFFIIGCSGHYNVTRLTEISDYVYAANMSFIVYTDDPRYPSQAWYTMAKSQYSDRFLGLYLFDEPGGHQLDNSNDYLNVWSASSYADAANQFVNNINPWLNSFSNRSGSLPIFTSDYALYWFDYKAGFNTVFAEFGWNYSQTLNVALCRGAATLQNRDWGVMMAWKYTTPPYFESGKDLLSDMIWAYQSGAKYIVVFDSNGDWTQDILGQEQLSAMQMFWEYAQSNPRANNSPSLRTAYVLPQDYAYGFRSPNDKIWGLWEADSIAYDLSISVNIMLTNYGSYLDIVYTDGIQAGTSNGYGNVIYWNDPSAVAQQWGDYPPRIVTPTPAPTPNFAPTPTLSPSPSSSSTPSTSPSPSPTPSASPTLRPPSTPDHQTNLFLTNGFYLVSAVVFVVVVGLVAFFIRRRRR